MAGYTCEVGGKQVALNAGRKERLKRCEELIKRCAMKINRKVMSMKTREEVLKSEMVCRLHSSYKLPMTTMNLSLPSPFLEGIEPGAGGESPAAPLMITSSSIKVLLFQPQL